MIKQNKYYSYNIKQFPVGCQYCVKGEKLVIFITGICPRKCYFCPVSDEKSGKDVTFANELRVKSNEDLIFEAKQMKAKGAGITGGDPLSRLDRTVEYIKLLKEEFGKEFHIHLYTSLNLVTKETLEKLYDSGLDEIRFHLDLDCEKFWEKLNLAKVHDWDIGVEVPLVPGKIKELKNMINFIHNKIKFLNLNELEVADNAQSKLTEMGFITKDSLSYAIKGSLELGLELLDFVKEKEYDLSVHVCSAKLKDKVQLSNRIKRESELARKKFDKVDEEGLLIRGALYLPELTPGFNYREKLVLADKELTISKLNSLFEVIKNKFKLKDEEIHLDKKKLRLLLSRRNAKKHKNRFKKLGLKPAIVTEYPTADQLEIEVEFLD